MTLLQEQYTSPSLSKCKIFLSHFYTLLNGLAKGYDYQAVSGFLSDDIFTFDKILFPICQVKREHWVLVRANLVNRTITLLDPRNFSVQYNAETEAIGTWLGEVAERAKRTYVTPRT